MPSAKDNCFEEATRAYEDATGKKLGVEFQRPWVVDRAGNWAEVPEESTFGKIMGSILKTLRIENGDQLPRAPGVPNPVAVRYPDVTMTQPDGTKIVIDNKFTGADGKPDPWRPQVNSETGSTQQKDYNAINQQNTKGDPNAKDLTLDKNTCNCGEGDPPGETVPVLVPSPFPGFLPMPAPGTTVPGLPGLPEFPGIPEFVFG